MTADAKSPVGVERRSRERVADDADWETKVLARIRGKLRREAVEQPANWEERVAAAVQERLDEPRK